jgi:16S rRNA processing protein RimM
VTNAARPLFQPHAEFSYERGEQRGLLRLRSVREHGGRLLIALDGIDSATAAEAFVGATLLAPKDAIPLASGEFLDEDLVGCTVVAKDGSNCGRVDRIEHYPASDMLVAAGKLIPMVSSIVLEVDTANRIIRIDPPAGLLD